MPTLIIMLVWAPLHIWNTDRPTVIQGWASLDACRAAAPAFEAKMGVTNYRHSGSLFTPDVVTEDRVPARVECLAFPNPEKAP